MTETNSDSKTKSNIVFDGAPKTLDPSRYITSNPGGTFTCTMCNVVLTKYPNAIRHILTIHETIRAFKCALCLKCFSSKQILMRHYASCEGKNRNGNGPKAERTSNNHEVVHENLPQLILVT